MRSGRNRFATQDAPAKLQTGEHGPALADDRPVTVIARQSGTNRPKVEGRLDKARRLGSAKAPGSLPRGRRRAIGAAPSGRGVTSGLTGRAARRCPPSLRSSVRQAGSPRIRSRARETDGIPAACDLAENAWLEIV